MTEPKTAYQKVIEATNKLKNTDIKVTEFNEAIHSIQYYAGVMNSVISKNFMPDAVVKLEKEIASLKEKLLTIENIATEHITDENSCSCGCEAENPCMEPGCPHCACNFKSCETFKENETVDCYKCDDDDCPDHPSNQVTEEDDEDEVPTVKDVLSMIGAVVNQIKNVEEKKKDIPTADDVLNLINKTINKRTKK